MHIVEVTGGLGNQMFQYAFGKYIKSKYPESEVKYDISYFDNNDGFRSYELGVFNTDVQVATKADIRRVRGYYQYDAKVISAISKRLPGRNRVNYIQEDLDKGFQPEVVSSEGGYYSGYWQCEKYFNELRTDILKDFSLKSMNIPQEYASFFKKAESENSVSIHIRLGDYLDKANYAIYGDICTVEYYKKAIEYIGERVPDARFYVFTNDADKAREFLAGYPGVEFVNFEKEVDYLDMLAMSKCKHNVIANSSFSWWGAWLNQNKEKIVLCPSRWFNNHEVADQLCDGWIKI